MFKFVFQRNIRGSRWDVHCIDLALLLVRCKIFLKKWATSFVNLGRRGKKCHRKGHPAQVCSWETPDKRSKNVVNEHIVKDDEEIIPDVSEVEIDEAPVYSVKRVEVEPPHKIEITVSEKTVVLEQEVVKDNWSDYWIECIEWSREDIVSRTPSLTFEEKYHLTLAAYVYMYRLKYDSGQMLSFVLDCVKYDRELLGKGVINRFFSSSKNLTSAFKASASLCFANSFMAPFYTIAFNSSKSPMDGYKFIEDCTHILEGKANFKEYVVERVYSRAVDAIDNVWNGSEKLLFSIGCL
ncbi:unnamed protein product [Anisakis simplex]|uniref:Cyclin N-terminal domain-containing protein n=1 Tax=Anisakis simplex TaxID=6269 RepID=A0A0M3K263_ANISI|nr:unnamed protein product [Anisakis simplex]